MHILYSTLTLPIFDIIRIDYKAVHPLPIAEKRFTPEKGRFLQVLINYVQTIEDGRELGRS